LSVVVDASVAVAWLVNDPASDYAAALLTSKEELLAPDLLPSEVANALWKRIVRGETSFELAEQLLPHFVAIGIRLTPAFGLWRAALQLATQLNHPVYDCLYLALAASHDAKLATADKRLIAAASKLESAILIWQP
jgi:predicted nucleic acid-binding protein